MGCGATKEPAAPAPGSVAFAAAKPLAPMTSEAQAAAQARTVRLLESLAAKEERVEQPVLSNEKRRRSGQRGMTRAFLFGVKAFFEQHNALDKTMQVIVNEPGFPSSVCELTKSTGLSLSETLVREAGEGEGIEELVGESTCFFSYSWTGTTLRDLLAAVERVLAKLEAADGKRRYVWVDILCASQNLLQGVIKDPDLSSAEVGIEDAISTANELLFYMEPLSDQKWAAPAHPFLLADHMHVQPCQHARLAAGLHVKPNEHHVAPQPRRNREQREGGIDVRNPHVKHMLEKPGNVLERRQGVPEKLQVGGVLHACP
jgi:hypothetical protein